jgi:hypothetical protein
LREFEFFSKPLAMHNFHENGAEQANASPFLDDSTLPCQLRSHVLPALT